MRLARREACLAVVTTVRADGSVQASLVNAGLIGHPSSGADVLAYVTYGRVKLVNLRRRPQTTVTFRSGWSWATVEGDAELIGPDDPNPAVHPEAYRLLLRQIFTAAGGVHDDWEEYDRVMAEQRRTVVLVPPRRAYGDLPPDEG
jgi:PPOX class probable F420-dependent enzyme